MSEQRPILGRTIDTDSGSDSLSVSQAAEAQLRQALEHMGGRRPGPAAAASSRAPARAPSGGAGSRHRYVREGEVPVVHASLGRNGATHPSPRSDAAQQQDKALIEQLRHDLERERTARESAERAMHEQRTAATALQTRLVHIEMDLRAAQEHAAEQAALVQATAADAAHARAAAEQAEQALAARRRPRADKPVEDEDADDNDGPQPVKWWVRNA